LGYPGLGEIVPSLLLILFFAVLGVILYATYCWIRANWSAIDGESHSGASGLFRADSTETRQRYIKRFVWAWVVGVLLMLLVGIVIMTEKA
jgi:hypothetical protein